MKPARLGKRWATPRELRLGTVGHGGEVRDGGVAKDAEACLIQRLRRRRRPYREGGVANSWKRQVCRATQGWNGP